MPMVFNMGLITSSDKSKFYSIKFPSLIYQPNTQATKSSLFMNLRCSYMSTSCINNHPNLFLFLVHQFS